MSTLLNPKAGDVYRDTLTDTVFRIDWVSRGQVYYCKAKARGDRQYTEGGKGE